MDYDRVREFRSDGVNGTLGWFATFLFFLIVFHIYDLVATLIILINSPVDTTLFIGYFIQIAKFVFMVLAFVYLFKAEIRFRAFYVIAIALSLAEHTVFCAVTGASFISADLSALTLAMGLWILYLYTSLRVRSYCWAIEIPEQASENAAVA